LYIWEESPEWKEEFAFYLNLIEVERVCRGKNEIIHISRAIKSSQDPNLQEWTLAQIKNLGSEGESRESPERKVGEGGGGIGRKEDSSVLLIVQGDARKDSLKGTFRKNREWDGREELSGIEICARSK